MKFLLLGDWPVAGGSMVVPASTLIEWEPQPELARQLGVSTEPQWCEVRLPLPMPLNAKALVIGDIVRDNRRSVHQPSGIIPPEPIAYAKPPLGRNGWVDAVPLRNGYDPLIERQIDAQDARDRAELERRFGKRGG